MGERYALEHPEWQVLTGSCPTNGPWVKARAVRAAALVAEAEILVLADADVWAEGLIEAVQAVESGADWALPHRGVFRLTEEATGAVLRGEDPEGQPVEQRPYLGIEGGGVTVLRRETLFDVPLDPRFIAWGQEDVSQGLALHCLFGPPSRAKRPLFHLWHPPQERMTRRRGSPESWRLYKRYHAARNDPDAMRSLLKEAHESFDADLPSLRDRVPQRVG